MSKPFDPQLYATHDARARAVARDYLQNCGLMVEDNPDQYGVDLIGPNRSGQTVGVEVEVKTSWTGSELPYEEVHIPYRKRSLLDLPHPCYFLMFNNSLQYGWWVWARIILTGKVITKDNIYLEGEQFFEVPKGKGTVLKFF